MFDNRNESRVPSLYAQTMSLLISGCRHKSFFTSRWVRRPLAVSRDLFLTAFIDKDVLGILLDDDFRLCVAFAVSDKYSIVAKVIGKSAAIECDASYAL